jgi:hypothetical protein
MQAQNRIIDLYQTDLDRHLFAMEPKRRQRGEKPIINLVSERVGEWMGGWVRWRTALANGVFSLL